MKIIAWLIVTAGIVAGSVYYPDATEHHKRMWGLAGLWLAVTLLMFARDLAHLFNGPAVEYDGPIEHEDGRPLGTRPRR